MRSATCGVGIMYHITVDTNILLHPSSQLCSSLASRSSRRSLRASTTTMLSRLFLPQVCNHTLFSMTKLFAFFSILFLQISSVSARNVHNRTLYSHLKYNKHNNNALGLLSDPSQPVDKGLLDQFDEWAGVQGFWDFLDGQINATPSRQNLQSKVTPSVSHRAFTSDIKPTPLPTGPLKHLDLSSLSSEALEPQKLRRRGSFTSNVCPITIQTTVFITVDGSTTRTFSTTSGPRPTGIPGDTGTDDGNDPGGGSTDSGSSSGQGLSGREGLITGLVIVIAILLASFCALFTYCYKKRRNARIQRLSSQRGDDAAEIVRRMGSKGIVNLSASGKPLPRSSRFSFISKVLPVAFFGSLFRRRPQSQRDSQSSELLERKQPTAIRSPKAWSTVGTAANISPIPEERDSAPPQRKIRRISVLSIPPIIASTSRPELPMASSSKVTGTPSPRLSSATDFVPLVQRRIDNQQFSANRISGLPPVAVEPVRYGSTPDLPQRDTSDRDRDRDPSPRRNSQGEPLSPSAWMAGFGLASNSNPEVFTNPSYISSSDLGHGSSIYSGQGRIIEDPTSPRSISSASVQSSQTVRPPLGSPEPAQSQQRRLSFVAEHNDVRPDGASDIISALGSAFGDRPDSSRSALELNDNHSQGHYNSHLQPQSYPYPAQSQSQPHSHPPHPTLNTRFHPLSDVEEVLTPVADERLSIHTGSPKARRPSNASNKQSPAEAIAFQNPFVDDQTFPMPPAPTAYKIRKAPMLRKISDATSSMGGVAPSEESATLSLTNTSIVEPGYPIDSGDWDDRLARQREEDQLFYAGALRSSTPPLGGEPSNTRSGSKSANPFES